MAKRKNRNYFEPQRHPDHPRPMTRRQLISQGFMTGAATVTMGSAFSLFSNPRAAYAALAPDLEPLKAGCPQIKGNVFNPVPFICFDLAGGANMANSNVLIGGQDGQFDFITTAGYRKTGLPGDVIPGVPEVAPSETATSNGDHTDTTLGLAFHSDSAFLRGILDKLQVVNRANVNGAVIPARSENDTGNNPHNPLYAIAQAGGDGELRALGRAAEKLADAFREGQAGAALEGLGEFAAALESFDAALELGIFSATDTMLAADARESGVVFKPCGAGGGDVAAFFALEQDRLERFVTRAADSGYVQLPVALGVPGLSGTNA